MYGKGREKRTAKGKEGKREKRDRDKREEKRQRKHRDENEEPGEASAAREEEMGVVSESLFVNWGELLRSREGLKRRIDGIAAVHGWQGRTTRKGFLGGLEPSTLLESIRSDIDALEPAAEALEKADLVLQLRAEREQLEALRQERDRLHEDCCALQEDCFEARDQLDGQTEEVERLRKHALERDLAEGRASGARGGGSGGCSGGGSTCPSPSTPASSPAEDDSAPADMSTFQTVLSRAQATEGKRVVQALERLKLPDEQSMGPRELACWRENRKTIVNSLRTLSGQIYSSAARVLYEIIQNADDCSFEAFEAGGDADGGSLGGGGGGGEGGEVRAPRELHLECSEEALVAFHNERGFQPADLYAMCQVGRSLGCCP
jgi:hypothetical protein